jgi:hypothetical protein
VKASDTGIQDFINTLQENRSRGLQTSFRSMQVVIYLRQKLLPLQFNIPNALGGPNHCHQLASVPFREKETNVRHHKYVKRPMWRMSIFHRIRNDQVFLGRT